jgi:hypothetical protein
MNYPKYDVLMGTNATIYEFTSTGQNGDVDKAVIYDTTKHHDIYNLAFGNLIYDADNDSYIVDDQAVDNNGDMREILATVAQTAYQFSSTYPDLKIFITGSDQRRTNTYKRAIKLNYEELSKTFDIFGALVDDQKNITDAPFDYYKDFDGFLFKRK